MQASPFATPRRRRSRAALAALAAALGAAVLAPGAQAAFQSPYNAACGAVGTAINGEGSTLQDVAQTQVFGVDFVGSTAPACANKEDVGYSSTGSGAGRGAVGSGDSPAVAGVRNNTFRFGATDVGLSGTQVTAINLGPTKASGSPDNAVIHEFPVLVAAVTADFHVPPGCTFPTTGPSGDTPGAVDGIVGGDAGDGTTRLALSNGDLGNLWANSTYTTWGSLGFTGTTTAAFNDVFGHTYSVGTDCSTLPIVRLVRNDKSGTTQVFQKFLTQTLATNPGFIDSGSNAGTPAWPAGGANTIFSSGTQTSGNQELAGTAASTPGTVTYLDLADARNVGFTDTTGNDTATNGAKFWAPLYSGSGDSNSSNGGTLVDPSVGATTGATRGYEQPAHQGANCASATFTNTDAATNSGGTFPPTSTVPGFTTDPTTAAWDGVTALPTSPSGPAVYPGCTLTYMLAFDDNFPAYGFISQNTGTAGYTNEEGNARTLLDYLNQIFSPTSQNHLLGIDYSPLPSALLGAVTGAGGLGVASGSVGTASIGWDKLSHGPVLPPVKPVVTPVVTPPGVTPIVTPVAPPSNAFSLSSALVSKSGKIVLKLDFPGKGAIAISATSKVKGHKIVVLQDSGSIGKAGPFTVTATPGSVARKDANKYGKITVSITITYTPTGGKSASKTHTLTLKGKAKKKKK